MTDQSMKDQYLLVCDMQGRWTLQIRVELDDHRTDWMIVRHFESLNEPGYYEAKKWMEENI